MRIRCLPIMMRLKILRTPLICRALFSKKANNSHFTSCSIVIMIWFFDHFTFICWGGKTLTCSGVHLTNYGQPPFIPWFNFIFTTNIYTHKHAHAHRIIRSIWRADYYDSHNLSSELTLYLTLCAIHTQHPTTLK